MTHKPTRETVQVWSRIFRIQKEALAYTEKALKAAKLPQLSWYDVLLELNHSDDIGLRPFELERALLLPQYGLSRLLDRIEKAKYLKRIPCEEDGRGQRLVITEEGRAILLSMWPIYAKAIQDILGSGLHPSEIEILSELLRKIKLPEV
ncbi:MarR family winged helix-turn-helix transcriptional regulator [Kiloniella antarctica]|uniref:MarR family winged helix-turn-helix transcriptional regulator n=1 Tax=Kiloniella antarctica TaxID=1550907 RepID=A0ABW5BML4_9PROT